MKEFSQKYFSDVTGFSEKNVSNIVKGLVLQPKSDFFVAIAQSFPELNLRWLLIGEGEMFHGENEMIVVREPKGPVYEKPESNLTATILSLSETVAQLSKMVNDVPALREEIEKLKARIQELERRK